MSTRELLAATVACLLLAITSRGTCSEESDLETLVFGTIVDRYRDGTCILRIELSLRRDLERVPLECWVKNVSETTDRTQLLVQCDADVDWSISGVSSVYTLKLASGSCPRVALQSLSRQHRWLVRRQAFDSKQQFIILWDVSR